MLTWDVTIFILAQQLADSEKTFCFLQGHSPLILLSRKHHFLESIVIIGEILSKGRNLYHGGRAHIRDLLILRGHLFIGAGQNLTPLPPPPGHK